MCVRSGRGLSGPEAAGFALCESPFTFEGYFFEWEKARAKLRGLKLLLCVGLFNFLIISVWFIYSVVCVFCVWRPQARIVCGAQCTSCGAYFERETFGVF